MYQERFAEGIRTLAEQLLLNRMWLSDKWIDTEAGKADIQDGKGVTMLDYACGTGAISLVSEFIINILCNLRGNKD
jgi:ubiquinone/menaquinone biosynthesis C-methylase UbiE